MTQLPPPETIHDVLDALQHWVNDLCPESDRAARIIAAVRGAVAGGNTPVDAETCRLIEQSAHQHSRHLALFFHSEGDLTPDVEDRGWPAPDLAAIHRRAGSISQVARSEDGIVTMRIDGLDPFDAAERYLDAAVALAARATGLILDLRGNGGGDPATVAFLAGFVLGGDPAPLSEVHGRHGVTVWQTAPPAPELRLSPNAAAVVLTSAATFSSGEALAYHLQARGRAIVIGEQTPGGADHVTPINLTRHVSAHLPIARVTDSVTGTNWERVGVRPDIRCPAVDAHEHALNWLRSSPDI